jgi:hypothetical protein
VSSPLTTVQPCNPCLRVGGCVQSYPLPYKCTGAPLGVVARQVPGTRRRPLEPSRYASRAGGRPLQTAKTACESIGAPPATNVTRVICVINVAASRAMFAGPAQLVGPLVPGSDEALKRSSHLPSGPSGATVRQFDGHR